MDIKGENSSRETVFLLLLRFRCEYFGKRGLSRGRGIRPFGTLFSFFFFGDVPLLRPHHNHLRLPEQSYHGLS